MGGTTKIRKLALEVVYHLPPAHLSSCWETPNSSWR